MIYLVGAGPGDPDLLTVKALRVLQQADVVLYDRLISAEVLSCINPQAVLIDVGKEEGQQHEIQQQIVPLLIEWSAKAQTVVRLKSGDPMVFARGGEELAELLEAGCEDGRGSAGLVVAIDPEQIDELHRGEPFTGTLTLIVAPE